MKRNPAPSRRVKEHEVLSKRRFGIAFEIYFSDMLSHFIDVEVERLPTMETIEIAARESQGNLVLLSNFPADSRWKEGMPASYSRWVDELVARNHPDPQLRFHISTGGRPGCDTYEVTKDFYRGLFRDFPGIELHVMTFASLASITDQEILSSGLAGRVSVKRLASGQSLVDEMRHVMEILERSGIGPLRWCGPDLKSSTSP